MKLLLFTLIPMVKEQIKIPVIAAGGIANGRGMLAAMVLGQMLFRWVVDLRHRWNHRHDILRKR
jgi:imidazole glycerol phosphate synthase subunit HisF